jgi:hypothetical protein
MRRRCEPLVGCDAAAAALPCPSRPGRRRPPFSPHIYTQIPCRHSASLRPTRALRRAGPAPEVRPCDEPSAPAAEVARQRRRPGGPARTGVAPYLSCRAGPGPGEGVHARRPASRLKARVAGRDPVRPLRVCPLRERMPLDTVDWL